MDQAKANENAQKQRDRRIRRRLLAALHQMRGNESDGWATGQFLVDAVSGYVPRDEVPSDEDHALNLLRDLVNGGYAEERDDREYIQQPFGLRYMSYRVTHKGSQLWLEYLEPDPMIEDDRRS